MRKKLKFEMDKEIDDEELCSYDDIMGTTDIVVPWFREGYPLYDAVKAAEEKRLKNKRYK